MNEPDQTILHEMQLQAHLQSEAKTDHTLAYWLHQYNFETVLELVRLKKSWLLTEFQYQA